MKVYPVEYEVNHIRYIIRSAKEIDAQSLSEVRLQIDGETEYLDREKGEGYLDELAFKRLIANDTLSERNIFLVAEVNEEIVGFSRCEGHTLRRSSHKVEFGVCVLKAYWGYGIGRNLLKEAVHWADSNAVKKITLQVLETNVKAIELYKRFGFEVEGVLRNDKFLSDGKYYSTLVMGRIQIGE